MTWELVQSVVRHLATLAGGWFISSGIIDPAATGLTTEMLVGVVMTIAALGWSFWNKKALREAPAVTG